MSKIRPAVDWREERRRSARDTIVDAAWALARQEGLAALSMRELAKKAGITTPTVYAYFESKNAIYDAMFGRAATEFAEYMARAYASDDPRDLLAEGVRRFVEFCTSDVARYHLLFQRTVPGFVPTEESFAPAVGALESLHARLALVGITDPRHIDMWTAWTTGLVDQQISNDPGGDRWIRLIDDFVAMFLSYCQPTSPRSTRALGKPSTKEGRS